MTFEDTQFINNVKLAQYILEFEQRTVFFRKIYSVEQDC